MSWNVVRKGLETRAQEKSSGMGGGEGGGSNRDAKWSFARFACVQEWQNGGMGAAQLPPKKCIRRNPPSLRFKWTTPAREGW